MFHKGSSGFKQEGNGCSLGTTATLRTGRKAKTAKPHATPRSAELGWG